MGGVIAVSPVRVNFVSVLFSRAGHLMFLTRAGGQVSRSM